MLLLAAKQWQVSELSVLCVRDHRGKLDAKRSLFLNVNLPHIPSGALCCAATADGILCNQVGTSKFNIQTWTGAVTAWLTVA